MKPLRWNHEKNLELQRSRNVSFEEVAYRIEHERVLDVRRHPSEKYAHQRIFVIEIEDYVYLVPFVEDEECIFLKTIIPSRKVTREFQR